VTYNDIFEGFESYEDITEAEDLWIEENYDYIAGLYIQLINFRNEAARESGYENYMEMALEHNDSGYTLNMAESSIQEISEHFVPFYRECAEDSFYYDINDYVDFDEFAPFAYEHLADMSAGLSGAFGELLEYGYYEYDLPDFSEDPFTIYLYSYAMPFVMSPYDGGYLGMTTFIHEFGHFYNFMLKPDSSILPTDILEIPSQALELMFAKYYPELDGDDGRLVEHDVIFDSIGNMAFYTHDAAVSFAHYSIPKDELSPEKLAEVTKEVNAGLGLDYFSDNHAGYSWLSNENIFEDPLGSFGYSTALCAAFELWGISIADEERAVEIYGDIIENSGQGFIDAVTTSGLSDPFDAGTIESIVDTLEENFLYVEWE